ncbi:flagellar motor switch protein FliN [Phycisphaerales bacterium AB-hyl4]|uniref:Flagellar motor switch protein FliN n=1 Tax=Natronomicrosphaera hydrolytica TaxID=3242702 RepID=A0ABV4U815_9BACT
MADQPQGKDTPDQPDTSQPAQSVQPGADANANDDASVDEALEAASASLDELKQTVEASAGAQDPADEAAEAGDEPSGTSLDLLGDVDLDVMIELGRTEMLVEDVLKLQAGSVVELDKLAGDPVDVYVNGRLVARGEVLVLNDNFCIRISEVLADLEQEAEAAVEAQQAGATSDAS